MTIENREPWFVYLLECVNGRLYTGITTDLQRRFARHLAGSGAKFTMSNYPSHIVAAQPCQDRSEASKLEYVMKKLKPAQKRTAALCWKLQNNLPQNLQKE